MKRLLLLVFIAFSITNQVNAQCVVSVNTTPSNCDSICNGTAFFQFNTSAFPVIVEINGMPINVAQNGFQMFGLCAGTYFFTAIDANGDTCTGNNTFMITQGPAMVLTLISTNATCQACNDGAIVAQVSGGSAPYTYLWSQGSNTPNLNNLSPGVYCITVADANGCSVSDCATIGIGNNGLYALEGEVYLDINSNGIKDIGEIPLGNQPVNIQPSGTTSLTNNNGLHLSIVLPGTHDVSFVPTPGWNLTSSPATYNLNVTSNMAGLDFGVYPDSTAGAAVVTLTSNLPRCLTNVGYTIHVNNTGFTSLTGTVELTYDPALTYVNSTPVPLAHIGNVLNYSFTNLPPGSVGYFNIIFTEPAAGTQLSSSVLMNASDSFGNTINQSNVLNQTVLCSMDPNDKLVFPAGIGASNYVAMDEWLTYQIRFQNTGTDTAFKVVILDTLDLNLDVSSMIVLGSSHTVTTSIQPSREVSFTFDNILLPDSNINEPASHGYVLYRIKGLSTNPDPTTVNNTAYIYFDLNLPVVTNTTLTTFSDNFLGVIETFGESNLVVFPNPMTGEATITWKENNNEEYFISIYDLTGREILSKGEMKNGTYKLNRENLTSGVYILEASPKGKGVIEHIRLVVK